MNPYEVLQLRPGCGPTALKQAYRSLIRKYKPEKHPEEFKEIRGAYELLLKFEVREPDTPDAHADQEDGSSYARMDENETAEDVYSPESESRMEEFLRQSPEIIHSFPRNKDRPFSDDPQFGERTKEADHTGHAREAKTEPILKEFLSLLQQKAFERAAGVLDQNWNLVSLCRYLLYELDYSARNRILGNLKPMDYRALKGRLGRDHPELVSIYEEMLGQFARKRDQATLSAELECNELLQDSMENLELEYLLERLVTFHALLQETEEKTQHFSHRIYSEMDTEWFLRDQRRERWLHRPSNLAADLCWITLYGPLLSQEAGMQAAADLFERIVDRPRVYFFALRRLENAGLLTVLLSTLDRWSDYSAIDLDGRMSLEKQLDRVQKEDPTFDSLAATGYLLIGVIATIVVWLIALNWLRWGALGFVPVALYAMYRFAVRSAELVYDHNRIHLGMACIETGFHPGEMARAIEREKRHFSNLNTYVDAIEEDEILGCIYALKLTHTAVLQENKSADQAHPGETPEHSARHSSTNHGETSPNAMLGSRPRDSRSSVNPVDERDSTLDDPLPEEELGDRDLPPQNFFVKRFGESRIYGLFWILEFGLKMLAKLWRAIR